MKPEIKEIFKNCYNSVLSGNEARKAVEAGKNPAYRKALDDQLELMNVHPLWSVNSTMKKLIG